MKIEVWSDLVCPWCYIGFVRLDKAIAELGRDDIEVVHHAYQLDRLAAAEPARAVEFLALAYGIEVEAAKALNADVTEVAAGEGLNYRLDANLVANTFLAHRLLAHAHAVGKGHEMLLRLFKASFEEALPIFSLEDLKPLAEEVGIDWEKANAELHTSAYVDVITEDRKRAEVVGVRGTPHFLFAEKIAVSGADSVAALKAAIAEAEAISETM